MRPITHDPPPIYLCIHPSHPHARTHRVRADAAAALREQVAPAAVVQREEDGGGGEQLHEGVEERVEGEGAAPREHARGWVAPVQEGGGGARGGGGGAGEGDLRGDCGVVEGVEEEGRGADGAEEEEAAAENGGERELGEAEHAEAVLEEEARGEDVAVGVGRVISPWWWWWWCVSTTNEGIVI